MIWNCVAGAGSVVKAETASVAGATETVVVFAPELPPPPPPPPPPQAASSKAAQAAAFLAAINVLPALGESLWDSSSILADRSVLGEVLHVLTGYTARPQGIQLVFYLGTLLVIGTFMRLARGEARSKQTLPGGPVPEGR